MENPVLVTTEHRGVFFGYCDYEKDKFSPQLELKKARCAIRWSTSEGFLELAKVGPNENSKIGAVAESLALQKVTSVSLVSKEAEKAWVAA